MTRTSLLSTLGGMKNKGKTALTNGIFSAASAYLIWGLLPVYWKALGQVPPVEQLAWRVLGCAVLSWILLARRRELALIGLIRTGEADRGIFLRIGLASLFLLLNWGLFIWAVSVNRMVEASLGYYINPLINVVLGIIFFSEKLGTRRLIALVLASVGVVIITLGTGVFPWVSLVLALCFGFYGLIAKSLPERVDSLESLAWVMVLLGPAGGIYLLLSARTGTVHLTGYGTPTTILISLAGFVTLLPLWLFGRGAKKLPLGMLGFLQYTAPTLMLTLGVLIYGEPFGWHKAAAFLFILVALGLYTSTLFRKGDDRPAG